MGEFDYDSLLKVLRSFGKINLDQFEERLRLQKLGYLSQQLGVNEGYPYSWYIHGPYSSTLTSVLFAGDEMGIFDDEVELTKNEKNTVKLLYSLLEKEVNDPNFLELYASIWYLMPKGNISNEEKDSIKEIMFKEKPQFSGPDVKSAVDKIVSFRQEYRL